MKKKFVATLTLVCLLLNSFALIPTFAATTFKEGVYQLSSLNITPKNRYTIQNISPDNSVYISLFDEEQRQIQSIHLPPKSENYSLIPLEPTYRIVIIGKGEVIIA
ncbi:hypothetical protein [Clostridium saccharobutylicum]|uniref:hypothetical protein n=1 Tax=Clostridium saccharobutylicum TaxID=169679 RepID=UPI0005A08548|nr:hypothetical protein [Clostridium saccharobutylicum]AQR91757.1 hypothetical protein CLOSC_34850 [Clostridium saccharobutylicum]AQS01659.1 hypothetical protein CSACC_34900 [Clostridium saccharobutylicum]AQS11269.1 hypothetical protein CLOBY_34250 [Clostridium saccharobutylicum]AQS15642.1 hypothetical protein CLOSACC_34900 [Clostridium saccharobutylicum]MBA2907624.1 hypothetical protein [Clostridium saccharobutylicum]